MLGDNFSEQSSVFIWMVGIYLICLIYKAFPTSEPLLIFPMSGHIHSYSLDFKVTSFPDYSNIGPSPL